MKKIFKRGLSVFLAVLLLLCAGPLEGFVGMQFPALPKFNLSSFFANEAKAANVDYSNLTTSQYMAKLLLNHNYSGSANDYGSMEKTHYQISREYYLNLNNVSASKVLYEETCKSTTFMDSVALWKVLTFDPSEAYENLLDEQGYYEAILLSILEVTMNDSAFLNALNCSTNKTILSLSKSTSTMLSTLKNIDINQINLRKMNISDWTDEEFQEIYSGLLADRETKKLYDTVGDHLDDFKMVLKTATTAYDLVQTVSKYSTLSDLSDSVKNVLLSIYNNCPNSNTAMKNACQKVYQYTSEEMTNGQIAFIEAGQAFINNAFSYVVGELWSWAKRETLAALGSSLLVGMNIGQAIGKTISNFMFSTDKIIEQFFVIEALMNFENAMATTVSSFENAYRSSESEEAADNYMQAIKMFFSMVDLDYSYAKDFVSISREKGAWNTIKLWFKKDETLESYKNSVSVMSNVINSIKEELTNIEWFRWDYEIDASIAYNHLFNTNTVSNTTVTIPYSNTAQVKGALPVSDDVNENYFLYEYSVDNNKAATITKVHPSSQGEAIIPKDVDGYAVRTIGSSAFKDCTGITSVVMPSTLTTISRYAFGGCTNLSIVTFNQGLKGIDEYAFSGTSITSAVIPKTVTTMGGRYYSNYGSSCFTGAEQLKTVTFEEGMQTIPSYALSECASVTTVILPTSLKNINERAFYDCTGLTAVSLPSALENIALVAFGGCSSLTQVSMPSSLKTIGRNAFYDCSNLSKVTLNEGLETIDEYAFSGTSITSAVIPKTVTTMGGRYYSSVDGTSCFTGAEQLKTVAFEEGMQAIPSYALSGCVSVTAVILPTSLKNIYERAFYGCTGLTAVSLPSALENIASVAFGGCSSLTQVSTPSSLKTIGRNAFYDCSNLSRVTFNEGLETIDEYAFRGTSIVSAVIPKTVTTMGGRYYSSVDGTSCFTGAEQLKTVAFEEGMQAIPSYALSGCVSVTTVILPTSLKNIYERAFYDCTGLIAVSLPSALENIALVAFGGCSSLTQVSMPSSLKTIGRNAFYDCSNLSKVTLNEGLETIDEYAFSGTSITSAVIPKTVTTMGGRYYSNYGSSCFTGANKLKTVVFTEGIKVVPNYALSNCSSIINVLLPSTIEEISSYAFYGCSSVADITIDEVVTKIDDNAFNNCTNLSTFHVVENSYAHQYAVNKGYNVVFIACTHTKTRVDQDRPATCTEGGLKTVVCAFCGEAIMTETTDPLGHDWDIIAVLRDATCTQKGYAKVVCSRCGDVTEIETDTLAHSYDSDQDDTCNVCGYIRTISDSHTPGDINGDSVLNNKDLNRLMKYLAGDEVDVVEAALDLNGDGSVNNKDLNRLMKYLAGEDVEIF